MSNIESTITIQTVQGGYILTAFRSGEWTTEVFTSHSKLLKTVKQLIEERTAQEKSSTDE